jgi:hypothetical protein
MPSQFKIQSALACQGLLPEEVSYNYSTALIVMGKKISPNTNFFPKTQARESLQHNYRETAQREKHRKPS